VGKHLPEKSKRQKFPQLEGPICTQQQSIYQRGETKVTSKAKQSPE
jgi:hypothetical protein